MLWQHGGKGSRLKLGNVISQDVIENVILPLPVPKSLSEAEPPFIALPEGLHVTVI